MSFEWSFELFPTIMEVDEKDFRPGIIIPQSQPERPERLCSTLACINKPFSKEGLCETHYIEKETICNHSNCKKNIYHNYLCWIHGGRRRCIEKGCPAKECSKEHLCIKHRNEHKSLVSKIQRETNPRPTRSSEVIIEPKTHIFEKEKTSYTLSKKKYKCQHCNISYKAEWYLKIHMEKFCTTLFPNKKKKLYTLTSNRRYKCPQCDCDFACNDYIPFHLKYHCQKKPIENIKTQTTKARPIILTPETDSESSETESEVDGRDDESDDEERVYSLVVVDDIDDNDGIYFKESAGTILEQQERKEEEVKNMIKTGMFLN